MRGDITLFILIGYRVDDQHRQTLTGALGRVKITRCNPSAFALIEMKNENMTKVIQLKRVL